MTPDEERAYEAGAYNAWLVILKEATRHIPLADRSAWAIERAEVVATLRRLCAEFGDNEWDDALHLSDVLDKHLALDRSYAANAIQVAEEWETLTAAEFARRYGTHESLSAALRVVLLEGNDHDTNP